MATQVLGGVSVQIRQFGAGHGFVRLRLLVRQLPAGTEVRGLEGLELQAPVAARIQGVEPRAVTTSASSAEGPAGTQIVNAEVTARTNGADVQGIAGVRFSRLVLAQHIGERLAGRYEVPVDGPAEGGRMALACECRTVVPVVATVSDGRAHIVLRGLGHGTAAGGALDAFSVGSGSRSRTPVPLMDGGDGTVVGELPVGSILGPEGALPPPGTTVRFLLQVVGSVDRSVGGPWDLAIPS